jgi:UDP-N-acetylglucosamine:LPS N-acetylglucosamine transferase|tara:strand:- start:7767 stop:8216 length:450 start_codon:yes stop_codon:yes gene_type:complete
MSNRILIVASNGGHLVQLLRLQKAFKAFDVTLVSTSETPPSNVVFSAYYQVHDSNFDDKFGLVKTALHTAKVIIRVRPKVVISTGAAPGLFCILWNRLMGRKAIWIDSIANTDTLSMSGKVAKMLTKHCYSQWEQVANQNGVGYIGAII